MSAVAPSSPTSVRGPVQVQFQLGLFREEVRVPAGNVSYGHAKRLAGEIIECKAIGTFLWGGGGLIRSAAQPVQTVFCLSVGAFCKEVWKEMHFAVGGSWHL